MQRKSHSSPAVRSPFKLLNTSVNFCVYLTKCIDTPLVRLLSYYIKQDLRFSLFQISHKKRRKNGMFFIKKLNISITNFIHLHRDLEISCHKRKIFEKEARWVMKYTKKSRNEQKMRGNKTRIYGCL